MPQCKKRISQRQTLVLIHGWGFGSAIWQPLLPYLNKRYSVVLVDLPGYVNAGEASATTWKLRGLTSELAALIDQPAIWCGWSMGGLLAIEVASRFPEKVQSLITLGTNPAFVRSKGWPCGVAPEIFANFKAALRLDAAKLLKRFSTILVQGSVRPQHSMRRLSSFKDRLPDNDALLAGLQLLETLDLRADLAELEMPHHHIFGESDALVPVAVASDIASLSPRAQVKTIPAPHWLWADNPQLLAQIIAP